MIIAIYKNESIFSFVIFSEILKNGIWKFADNVIKVSNFCKKIYFYILILTNDYKVLSSYVRFVLVSM